MTTINKTQLETKPPQNATTLEGAAFLMNCPFGYCADEANNAWMEELSDEGRHVDLRKALNQFQSLYSFIASQSMVYLIPTPRDVKLQDLVFTANLGIVLEHVPNKNTVVISNYTSLPRRGETAQGESFFKSMGYDVHTCPFRFEGEAELKHLYDNLYIGAYGQRSTNDAFDWMEREFDMKVIRVELTDPYLYHLDCVIFPLTHEKTLVCTEKLSKEEVSEIERYTEIIDAPYKTTLAGSCNSVRVGNTIMNHSHIHSMKRSDPMYGLEVLKNRYLEDIASMNAFEVSYFNLSEYMKGGGLLSCMVMHLNRYSYNFKFI